MEVMEKNHGGSDNMHFLEKDMYNFLARLKKERIEGRDADYVLNYLQSKQDEDNEFYYRHTVDGEGRLQNLFWYDSQSQLDYVAFGDVVIFDSTYRVNQYNLPFVPFVGVDHHQTTVVFGCGIISDETSASYKWLLQKFLEAMRHKHPESVITDGDKAMAIAIASVMPGADHRLCSWHIEQNMIRHLRGRKLKLFRKFIYHAMQVEDFERHWALFIETHGTPQTEQWMTMMYELRTKWSAAYCKSRKLLGMQSNQRSESLNSRLHNHLDRLMSLVDLVEHYEFCLSCIRRNSIERDGALRGVRFTDLFDDLFVKRAAEIYSPTMFCKVRMEVKRMAHMEVQKVAWDEDDDMVVEVASHVRSPRLLHVVCTLDGSTFTNVRCSCRMLECEGIPCSHIFCAMSSVHLDDIPECCIVSRWTMKANSAFPLNCVTNTHVWSEQMDRFRGMKNKANNAFWKASMSVELTEHVMQFIDEIMAEFTNDSESKEYASLGPLPAFFSSVNQQINNAVLNPNKITGKGAPPTNKRMRRFFESLRSNW